MTTEKTQNLFQSFFRSELTWLGMIVVCVYGFIVTVVIPVNNLQLQVAQIQVQLTAQNKTYSIFTTQVQTLTVNQQVDEEKINQLENHIYTSK